jgi:hypothetical protein
MNQQDILDQSVLDVLFLFLQIAFNATKQELCCCTLKIPVVVVRRFEIPPATPYPIHRSSPGYVAQDS